MLRRLSHQLPPRVSLPLPQLAKEPFRRAHIGEPTSPPLLSGGAEAFYDPRTGELDPTFAVHIDQLRTLLGEARAIIETAETISEEVRNEVERLR